MKLFIDGENDEHRLTVCRADIHRAGKTTSSAGLGAGVDQFEIE
jgi:hypothetical protein